MAVIEARPCLDMEETGFNTALAAAAVWEAFLTADVFIEGNFVFASGQQATLKAEAERLYNHEEELDRLIGLFASHPCIQSSDTLLYVPDGPREFTRMVSKRIDTPVAHSIRREGAVSKYDFEFTTPMDEELAKSSKRPVIIEDVVTTLGSVAAMRRLLRPDQDVHSLAMLLRGQVEPQYRDGLVDHYLLEREIPTDKEEFKRRLNEEWL